MNKTELEDIAYQCELIKQMHPEVKRSVNILLSNLYEDVDAPYEHYQDRVYSLYREAHDGDVSRMIWRENWYKQD